MASKLLQSDLGCGLPDRACTLRQRLVSAAQLVAGLLELRRLDKVHQDVKPLNRYCSAALFSRIISWGLDVDAWTSKGSVVAAGSIATAIATTAIVKLWQHKWCRVTFFAASQSKCPAWKGVCNSFIIPARDVSVSTQHQAADLLLHARSVPHENYPHLGKPVHLPSRR